MVLDRTVVALAARSPPDVDGKLKLVESVPVKVSVLEKVAVFPVAIDKLPRAKITLLDAPSGASSSVTRVLKLELVAVAMKAANPLAGVIEPKAPDPPLV